MSINRTIETINFPVKQNIPGSGTYISVLPRINTDVEFVFPAVCGDSQDVGTEETSFLGNGILLKNSDDGALEIRSSLTGLPPLYLYRDERCSVIADTIESIAKLPCCSLHLNAQSVVELAKIGSPINHNTLFKEIEIVPAGALLSINNNTITLKEGFWEPSKKSFDSIDDYLDQMAAVMQAAIARMDLSNSFLSLTAGLDTRAVIASLGMQDKLIPAFTLSGMQPTLDTIRASQLCEYYGIPHTAVAIDNALEEKLPAYSRLASLYSGGLNSFEQATELYFYDIAGPDYNGRLSGNLGNQVGRSGTEGTGVRGAPITSLGKSFNSSLQSWDSKHWFYKANPVTDLLSPQFIIPLENLFAQLGNYSIGHEFVTQKTPYADRTLIDMKYSEPPDTRDKPESIKEIKLRDLKHRIIGQSLGSSFQCRVVHSAGGFVAACPINWGWKVGGGFSPGGLYYGFKAFSDFIIGNKLDRVPGANKLLRALGVKGFSSFHTRRGLYTGSMQSFAKDLFSMKSVHDSGLFNKDRLDYLCSSAFMDESNYDEIVLTMDLALAIENFNASF